MPFARKPLLKSCTYTMISVIDCSLFPSHLTRMSPGDPWSRLTWCWEFLEMCGQLAWLPLPCEQWMVPFHRCPGYLYCFFHLLHEVTLSLSSTPQDWSALITVESAIGQANKVKLGSLFLVFLLKNKLFVFDIY